ncbi:heat-responsive transcription factor HSF85 [Hordeum vulgare]|nr:heat-responsive transcription factor HSF85 [Hordeum vulgare]
MLAMEVVWLRNEQRATEERVAAMWRRVQETERRPKQMLAFLLRVVGDPDVLRRLAGSSGSGPGEGAEVKRSRLLLDSDNAGVDELSYQRSGNDQSPEAALVPEPSVDLYFAGGNRFGDV